MAEPILPSDASPLVRIRKDSQMRSVWSVHLPGWLEKGWRPVAGTPEPSVAVGAEQVTPVAGSKEAATAEEPSAPVAAEPAGPEADVPAPEESRPRRGRRKAAAAQKPEEPTKPEPVPSEGQSKVVADVEQPNGAESHAEPEPDTAIAAVAGLPEDLFDDPLA